MKRAKSVWSLILLLIAIGACAGPRPLKDFTLARTAIESARRVEAGRLAPKYWNKAGLHYRNGIYYFKQNLRSKAQEQFVKSRKFAEKAENQSRIKKFQTGDISP